MRTVVGLFNRFEDAQGAIKLLHDAGFTKEDINLIARDEKGEYSRYLEEQEHAEHQDLGEGTAAGAGIGAVLGGLGGLLLGLGALAIPGIGPVIAAGPIATTLLGAGAGALAGGIVGALVDLGIPKEHAEAYAEGIRRGGVLVTVRTTDDRSDDAVQILERFHPVDINQQMQTWRGENWQGFDEHAEPYETETTYETSQMENVPVTGRDQGVNIPVVEEDVTVEQRGTDDFQTYESGFHSHFDRFYSAQVITYEEVMPAYRYGYSLARDRRFIDYDWEHIEPEARIAWERRYGETTWDRIKDAVRHAWDEVRRKI